MNRTKKHELSKRELEALPLFLQGICKKEVAFRLSISIKTVEKHKQAIYYKWGVNNNFAFIRHALRTGHITLEKFLSHHDGENCHSEVPPHLERLEAI